MLVAAGVSATELVHQFNSPAFSGMGYSSHVLTIEQLEARDYCNPFQKKLAN